MVIWPFSPKLPNLTVQPDPNIGESKHFRLALFLATLVLIGGSREEIEQKET